MTLLDPLGTLLSLIAVYCFTKAKKNAWLVSIPAIFVNGILYWQKGIYAHACLDLVYLATDFYGLLIWTRKEKLGTGRSITHMPKFWYIYLAIFSIFLIFFTTTILSRFLNSDIAFWDALTTSLALIAHFMLCQKWLECWILWFFVDCLMTGLNWYKGIPFHSFHHFIYLFLAVLGYYRWQHIVLRERTGGLPSLA